MCMCLLGGLAFTSCSFSFYVVASHPDFAERKAHVAKAVGSRIQSITSLVPSSPLHIPNAVQSDHEIDLREAGDRTVVFMYDDATPYHLEYLNDMQSAYARVGDHISFRKHDCTKFQAGCSWYGHTDVKTNGPAVLMLARVGRRGRGSNAHGEVVEHFQDDIQQGKRPEPTPGRARVAALVKWAEEASVKAPQVLSDREDYLYNLRGMKSPVRQWMEEELKKQKEHPRDEL